MSNPWESYEDQYDHIDNVSGPMSVANVLFSFDGRIPRSTYWLASLGAGIAFMVGIMVLVFAIIIITGSEDLANLAVLVMYIPMLWASLAIQVKRWHDRGKSGFWMFIGVIPIVGSIWTFVELGLLPGDSGPNLYGPATY